MTLVKEVALLRVCMEQSRRLSYITKRNFDNLIADGDYFNVFETAPKLITRYEFIEYWRKIYSEMKKKYQEQKAVFNKNCKKGMKWKNVVKTN